MPAGRWFITLASACGMLAVGCVELLDEEHPGLPVEQAEQPPPAVPPRAELKSSCDYDGSGEVADALSVPFEQGAHWLFFHLPSVDEPAAPVTSAALAPTDAASDPCAGLEPVLDSGKLAAVLELDAEETAFNDANTGEELLALWPVSAVVDRGRAIVFYRKMLFGKDAFPVILGVGVAELSFGATATRLLPAHYPDEPSMLWVYPQTHFGTGALLHSDGLLYVYGCMFEACSVARVAPDRVAEPDAYEYYGGSKGWQSRLEQAISIMRDAEYMSVAFNPLLGKFLQVTRQIGPTIVSAVADDPWGPYTDVRPLFVDDNAGSSLGFARQHPAYQSADGIALLVSSQRGHDAQRALRLRRVELQ